MKGLDKFKKVKGIKDLGQYDLPTPQTTFIFDFNKQEKEINAFIKNRSYLMIRSDKENELDFCPHNLICPKAGAKDFIKKLTAKKFVVILQECISWKEDKLSGNILTLKNGVVIELMRGGPLIFLNRDGQVDEYLRVNKKGLVVEYSGKKIINKTDLDKVIKLIKKLPPYKIVEFSIGPDWLYFWQIREDKTAKGLES
jgi:hypothetical protein